MLSSDESVLEFSLHHPKSSFPRLGYMAGEGIVIVRDYMSQGYRCRLLQLKEMKLNARGQCWKVTSVSFGSLKTCNVGGGWCKSVDRSKKAVREFSRYWKGQRIQLLTQGEVRPTTFHSILYTP